MPLRLPPLAALRLFEAAARHLSFKQAADELGLTPSAVSHGIASLEAWLGVELFERSATRGVALTEAGRAYLPYVSEALSMIAIGTQRLPGRRSERRVTLSVAPTFASRWLVPRLQRFRARYPAVAIALDTSHRQILFPLDGVDLAIRMGAGGWPGVESHLLLRESLVPVAAPGYLATLRRDGALDWSRATLIHVGSISNDWATWLDAAGLDGLGSGTLQFDTIQLALDAAAEGLGLAMGHLPLVEQDFAGGRLVQASEQVVPVDTGYWLVGTTGKETRTEIRAFMRWILEEARGETAATRNIG